MSIRAVLLVGASALLFGCAANRPSLPSAEYVRHAKGWVGAFNCATAGMISADDAAFTRSAIEASLSRYAFSQVEMKASVDMWEQAFKSEPVTKEFCTTIAMGAATDRQKLAAQNTAARERQAESQRMLDSTRRTQTYCNQVGTQTLCSSN